MMNKKTLSVAALLLLPLACSPATERTVQSIVTNGAFVDACAELVGTRPRVVRFAVSIGLAARDVARQLCGLPAIAEQAARDPDSIDSALADQCMVAPMLPADAPPSVEASSAAE